jgi:hypothetical protein
MQVLQHKQLELALEIQRVAPFGELPLSALFVLAGSVVRLRYGARAQVLAAGDIPGEVHIPLEGTVLCGSRVVDSAFDVAAVALGRRLGTSYLAGEHGCTTGSIARSHLFTLLRDFPEVSLTMAAMPGAGSVAR